MLKISDQQVSRLNNGQVKCLHVALPDQGGLPRAHRGGAGNEEPRARPCLSDRLHCQPQGRRGSQDIEGLDHAY